MGKKKKGFLRDTAETLVTALILALFIRAFFIQVFYIPSGSMEPTLDISDRIIVSKIKYGLVNPLNFLNINETIFWIPNPLYQLNLPWLKPRSIFEFGKPQREEVIVFRYPYGEKGMSGKDLIKRVIGLPKDTLELKDGTIYINNQALAETHPLYKDQANFGPIQIPQGYYFMMGDNRANSADSRYWGFLPQDYILGKAFLIIWPLNHFGLIPQ